MCLHRTAPPELAALRERAGVLASLGRVQALLFWDQNTMMPPRGAAARGDHQATLESILHERLCDPALGRLLDALEPWAAGEDPDADDVRLVAVMRRDVEKAVRVPDLAGRRHEPRRRASARPPGRRPARRRTTRASATRSPPTSSCATATSPASPEAAHPYDVLLDDFEPGMTMARVRPLLEEVREGLVPLIEAADGAGRRPGRARRPPRGRGPAAGGHGGAGGRSASTPTAGASTPRRIPFAQGIAPGDTRITTRYDLHDFAGAFFGCLHEFGHGLYEAQHPRPARATPLGDPVSLGVHESQTRLWENSIGRGRPFCTWVLPRLPRAPSRARRRSTPRRSTARSTRSSRSLIRVEADEATYNLHIVLRFELELALVDGTLAVADLPHAWNEGMHRLLGLDVPGRRPGRAPGRPLGRRAARLLPDLHARQPVRRAALGRLRARAPRPRRRVERGDFEPLREWLRQPHPRPRPQAPAARAAAPRDRAGARRRRSCATCGPS